jgi:hypothetical protein
MILAASGSGSSPCMSPRRARVAARAAAATIAGLLASPGTAAAHAIGDTYQLPVPLWLYLAGAALAVAASFVVTALLSRGGTAARVYPTWPVSAALAGPARIGLRLVGLAWWYGAIVAGLAVGDISPLPAVLFWIGIWVGLPIAAVVAGNPWPSLSPFRSTFGALEWVARRLGASRLDAGVAYPARLARWPSFVLLAVAIWAELILPGSAVARTVAVLMLAYTALTLAGMAVFGQIAWVRHAELFEVYLGWFGRVGPIARISSTPELCDGCEEACRPERCIDCPECAGAAEDGERQPALRPWVVGLTDVVRGGWSDAAFIVLALAGVSYDGMRETAFGAALLDWLLPPVEAVFGITGTTFLVVETAAFALVFGTFWLAFLLVAWATRDLGDPGLRPSLGRTAGLYATTLLPIAAGYLVAHYLTLVIRGLVWLPSLLADPLLSLAPNLDWLPAGFVWYLSVAAIVGGHVAGIVLAHRHALRDAPSRPTVAGLPVVALMIGYTVLSLWIIAQPIVVEAATLAV